TVEGQIVNTYNSDKVIFLNFDQDYRNSFKVVIFPDAWSLFPDSPDIYFQDKMVRVTGSIKIYQNSPEIIVDQPDQIEILE
ncbi:MAG TPA: nuclease, partial [Anaerolineae bacterium]|nr:nuclease [Anaerolineae bacterium]